MIGDIYIDVVLIVLDIHGRFSDTNKHCHQSMATRSVQVYVYRL